MFKIQGTEAGKAEIIDETDWAVVGKLERVEIQVPTGRAGRVATGWKTQIRFQVRVIRRAFQDAPLSINAESVHSRTQAEALAEFRNRVAGFARKSI